MLECPKLAVRLTTFLFLISLGFSCARDRDLGLWRVYHQANNLPSDLPIPRSPDVLELPPGHYHAAMTSRSALVAAAGSYKSWSLFLVCDPQWLVESKEKDLRSLHELYIRFGETSGPKHAAVWFTRSYWPRDLDTERSVYYCKRFGLTPSEGPHIVATTVHPDDWNARFDGKVTLSFGDKSAEEMAKMISRLNDAIYQERLADSLPDDRYWQTWVRIIIQKSCVWMSKVKFNIDAKIARVERTGVCD